MSPVTPTPRQSEPDLVVLQTLRCIGFASEERVGSAVALDTSELAALLRSLSDTGLLDHQPGPFGGWGLTERGRSAVQELIVAELATTGADEAVRDAYGTFLQLNPVLLDICGDWQMRKVGASRLLNDHADTDYDAGVLSRLMRLDDEAQQICADLSGRLTRFEVYGRRLSTAVDRAMAGDTSSVTDSMDSYHTVWFQLHEDLLTTLGISRNHERSTER